MFLGLFWGADSLNERRFWDQRSRGHTFSCSLDPHVDVRQSIVCRFNRFSKNVVPGHMATLKCTSRITSGGFLSGFVKRVLQCIVSRRWSQRRSQIAQWSGNRSRYLTDEIISDRDQAYTLSGVDSVAGPLEAASFAFNVLILVQPMKKLATRETHPAPTLRYYSNQP